GCRTACSMITRYFQVIAGARNADLVIRDADKTVLVAAEFKYEPSHARAEFRELLEKLPAVFWGMDGVAKDLARIREFVAQGRARGAIAVFVSEGGYFRKRPAPGGSAWGDWA